MVPGINLLAVLACVLSSFFLGGLWYNKLFFKFYAGECKNANHAHPAIVFLIAFAFWIITSLTFAIFLGPAPEFAWALRVSLIIGVCFVATSFGVNYVFAGKRLCIFFIDAGYHILQFALYGIILGLWH